MQTLEAIPPFFDKQLLTIEDLSHYLNVPIATIRDWVFKRQLPYKKIGRHVRFDPLDIREWLCERSQNGHREN